MLFAGVQTKDIFDGDSGTDSASGDTRGTSTPTQDR